LKTLLGFAEKIVHPGRKRKQENVQDEGLIDMDDSHFNVFQIKDKQHAAMG